MSVISGSWPWSCHFIHKVHNWTLVNIRRGHGKASRTSTTGFLWLLLFYQECLIFPTKFVHISGFPCGLTHFLFHFPVVSHIRCCWLYQDMVPFMVSPELNERQQSNGRKMHRHLNWTSGQCMCCAWRVVGGVLGGIKLLGHACARGILWARGVRRESSLQYNHSLNSRRQS